MMNNLWKNLWKSLILAALALCLLLPAASADEITAEALKTVLDESPYINLFDVRDAGEYEAGAIPGAVSFPLDQLEASMKEILDNGFSNMDVPVYLYGRDAADSAAAADIMTGLGFKNVSWLAGVEAWPYGLLQPDQLLGGLDTVDIYGQPIDAGLIRGKKLVMVNVWATYCNPCISEMQGLGDLARQVSQEGILIVGLLSDALKSDLSVNDSIVETARLIAESTKADYPHLLPSRALYRNVISQIQAVPTTFFVDGEGRMVGQVYMGSRSEDEWNAIIRDTLAGLE